MMSKFLLLFCFTTLYVLGEGQGIINATQTSEEHLPDTALKPKHLPSEDVTQAPMISTGANTNIPEHPKPTPPTTTSTTPSTTTSIKPPKPPKPPTPPNPPTTSTTTSTTPSTTSTAPNTTPTTTTTTTTDIPVVPTTPLPPQNPAKWIVSEKNTTCIVVQMSVQFNITYPKANKTVSYITFDMPIDNVTTKASGNCGKLEQVLTLTWSPKRTPVGNMSLHFKKNETTSHYSLHHLEIVLPATDFLNTTLNQSMVLIHEPTNYAAGLTNSYRCLKEQKLNLQLNGTANPSYITISGLQFQAFKTNNSTNFGLAKDCAFDTPDAVPIVVGCALAGLVIIVLIAYLAARRRSQARGYVSM